MKYLYKVIQRYEKPSGTAPYSEFESGLFEDEEKATIEFNNICETAADWFGGDIKKGYVYTELIKVPSDDLDFFDELGENILLCDAYKKGV
jgi:hypothetical protein